MNTTRFLVPLVSVLTLSAPLEAPGADTPCQITARGPHTRTWSRIEFFTNRVGRIVSVTNTAFIELSTGLHHRDPATGQFSESEPRFEITPEGYAVARHGQHRVILAPNINTANEAPVDLELPDGGGRLTSRPLGLVFHDRASGSNALVASLQDCAGKWVSPGVVLFPDAFQGLHAALRFSYSASSFSQDLLLYENPGSPSAWGLNPASAELQIWTEWFTAPNPRVVAQPTDDGEDERVEFPTMALGQGRAYFLDLANHDQASLLVKKIWRQIGERKFLIEAIRYETAKPLLQRLAAVSAPSDSMLAQRTAIGPEAFLAQLRRQPPVRANLVARITPGQMPDQPALVWDYTLLNATETNYTFRGDSTYFIGSTVNLFSTTTVESSAILKYSNHASAKLVLNGPLVCKTDAYRPAIFTSKDDRMVGGDIPGSTGTPTNYNGGTYLQGPDATTVYQYLRMSYAGTGIYGYPSDVWHCQFFRCGTAIMADDDADIRLRNVLFSQCGTAVNIGGGNSLAGEHVTADQLNKFFDAPYCTGALTNSILTAVTNIGGNVALYSCTTNSSGSGIYQTVGGASYYLADGSTNRNSGTTSLNATLLGDLRLRTTYPPILWTNNFTTNTNLAPQAQRDSDLPDRGYHYDPLDWVVSGRTLTNSTLTLTNGVVLGTYGPSSSYGLYIRKGGNLVSGGSASALNRIVRYNTAQEQSTTNWSASTVASAVKISGDVNPQAKGTFRFTGWSLLGGQGNHFEGDYPSVTTAFAFRDCQFGSGSFVASQCSVALTNCLLERVSLVLDDDGGDYNYYAYNNLFRSGATTLGKNGSGSFQLKDNLFDQTSISQSGTLTHSNNGYVSGLSRLTPTNSTDVVLTNAPTYQTSWLGRYYYPTNDGMLSKLINVGSRYATNAGLYHFCTTTNQAKEAGSKVDIGFHYVATDANGIPIDTNGDSLPDYFADSNGNGAYDTSDVAPWNSTDSDGDGMPDWWESLYGLNPNSASDAALDPDNDGLTNLEEYLLGSNPGVANSVVIFTAEPRTTSILP